MPIQANKHSQVRSRARVTAHGEVFTSPREVEAMLNLVKQETERIESRFLEPACGNGNFLVPVLQRKLAVVTARYKKSQREWEFNAITAVSSIYGIDILEDNVKECRERLLACFTEHYYLLFKQLCKPACIRSAKTILGLNILWGDALSLTTPGVEGTPIIFPEWAPVNGAYFNRKDYTMDNLMVNLHSVNSNMVANNKLKQENITPLFNDENDPAFLPVAIAGYPPIHFLEIGA